MNSYPKVFNKFRFFNYPSHTHIFLTPTQTYAILLGMKENNYFLLKQKEDINFQDFIDFLSKHNYFRTNNVQQIGEMSVKGDIVDVFPFGFTEPIRIDFNFDTVEKIRKFDIQTKRMKSTEASIKIYPMTANYISNIFTKKTKRPKGRFTKEYFFWIFEIV